MSDIDLTKIRNDLKSTDSLTCVSAIRAAIAAIPNSTPLLGGLYSVYLSTKSPSCASAADAAIRRHRSDAVPFLLQLMTSKCANDRRNAIHFLVGLGHHRSSFRIYEQILDPRPCSQPDWGLQRELVIERLNAALNDPDTDVRTIAAVTLDDIGETPKAVVEILIGGLNSSDIYIQNISALHLGRLGATAYNALSTLSQFVQSNSDPSNGTRRPVLAARNAIQLISST